MVSPSTKDILWSPLHACAMAGSHHTQPHTVSVGKYLLLHLVTHCHASLEDIYPFVICVYIRAARHHSRGGRTGYTCQRFLTELVWTAGIFYVSAPTNRSQRRTAIYCRYKQEKHRAYEQWVGEIERASFTPMVFAASGEMGKANIVFCTEATSHRPTVPQWDGFAQPWASPHILRSPGLLGKSSQVISCL